MTEVLGFASQRWDFLVALGGLLGTVWWLSRQIADLRNDVRHTIESVKSHMVSNNFLIGALVEHEILPADEEAERAKELLRELQEEDHLEYDEAKEFFGIAKKFAEENPEDRDFQQMLELAAYVLGRASSAVAA